MAGRLLYERATIVADICYCFFRKSFIGLRKESSLGYFLFSFIVGSLKGEILHCTQHDRMNKFFLFPGGFHE